MMVGPRNNYSNKRPFQCAQTELKLSRTLVLPHTPKVTSPLMLIADVLSHL